MGKPVYQYISAHTEKRARKEITHTHEKTVAIHKKLIHHYHTMHPRKQVFSYATAVNNSSNNPTNNHRASSPTTTTSPLASSSINWDDFVDPTEQEAFDAGILEELMASEDMFDDAILLDMFHWNPDHYDDNYLKYQTQANVQRARPNRNKTVRRHKSETDKSVRFQDKEDTQQESSRSSSPPGDDELLKNRSAIFALDYSTDSDSECKSEASSSLGTAVASKKPVFAYSAKVQTFVPGRSKHYN